MKRLLFLCLLVAGCKQEATTSLSTSLSSPNSEIPFTEYPGNFYYSRERVMMITNSGHRFLIANVSGHDSVSMCEVTDASLVDGGLGRIVTNALHDAGLDTRPYAEDYWKPDTNGLTIAWKDGWMAYAIDYAAVSQFHQDAASATNSAQEFAVWQKCIENANRMESNWNALTKDQKLAYPISPFWKQSRGTPRRIP